jgi:hypothetical protein
VGKGFEENVMADVKDGDSIIEKKEDSEYDVLRVVGGDRELVRTVQTFDQAADIAFSRLPEGGRRWYRDRRDPPDQLEPFR